MRSCIGKCIDKFLPLFAANIRYLSTQKVVQEVRIPVSTGILAGKWWGPTDKRPIVAFHGWQDNCGTFDKLIPILPDHIPVLALDSPGHGHSFRYPPGIPYHNSDVAILIKELIRYFNWKKITLMGHSLGAILSYTYGYLFPKDVDFLICIDGLNPLVHPKKMKRVIQSVEEFLKYDALQKESEEPPSYTIPEMIKRVHIATRKSVAEETAKYILCRNIAPSKRYPGKYYFSRDARLKVGPLNDMDPVEIIKCAANVNFPVFVSKAKESPFFGNESIFNDVFEVLKKSSSDCQFHEIPGSHHVHLNDPAIVAGLITEFIKKHDHEDRNYGGLKPEMICSEDTLNLDIFSAAQTA